ncbi:hypothetical protein TNIN_41471 [Trichonephila inaurata madagascariensis]|uniref:Uncharacterized protein n=1 Tax=Trichonephila inaurata madagascariensis TaxID=2747483 RepID=A0A8X6XCN4_9ARAC|nr:hypothetical protein TNIN_41471 [Trichonephila inaurata madagascariensis]
MHHFSASAQKRKILIPENEALLDPLSLLTKSPLLKQAAEQAQAICHLSTQNISFPSAHKRAYNEQLKWDVFDLHINKIPYALSPKMKKNSIRNTW